MLFRSERAGPQWRERELQAEDGGVSSIGKTTVQYRLGNRGGDARWICAYAVERGVGAVAGDGVLEAAPEGVVGVAAGRLHGEGGDQVFRRHGHPGSRARLPLLVRSVCSRLLLSISMDVSAVRVVIRTSPVLSRHWLVQG